MPRCPNYGHALRSAVSWSSHCLGRLPGQPSAARHFSSRNVNNPWQALTWIAPSPHSVTPADILPAYAHLRASPKNSSIVPILFASPEFTQWTDPANPLLAQWATPLFNQIYSGHAPDVVYTVAAVVDRIPAPESKNGKHTAPAAEGLSLLLADSSCITASVAPSARARSSNSEEPAFLLKTQIPNRETTQPSHEVGLRLAQTVFRNGRDRTLLGMWWTRDRSSGTYALSDSQELSTCSVACPASEARCSINVPLHPVTKRRRVVSSMGNILRQVSKSVDDDGTDAGMPASSELEKELPRYVSELGIPHQRVAVWALVEPSTAALPAGARAQSDFANQILAGSKIHRVVSGGGGWGKKQGLLSLDPETMFESQHHTSLDASLADLFQTQSMNARQAEIDAFQDVLEGKGLEENMASLSQVASPGDYIQFFVASDSAAVGSTEVDSQASTPAGLSYSFGVEPPLEAEVAESSLETSSGATSSGSSSSIVVIHDHFGAVSESAISYSQGGLGGTKISVPGSRVELLVA